MRELSPAMKNLAQARRAGS